MGDSGFGSKVPQQGSRVSRSHTFNFSIYGTPSLDELIYELQQAREVMGGNGKVRIRNSSDQRDGDTVMVTVTE